MLKAFEIFTFMSPALAEDIIDQIHRNEKNLYMAALHGVAELRRFRPVFLEQKQRADQHKEILSAVRRSGGETLALNLLQAWLLKLQTGMLTDFLDALGVAHQKGLVDSLPATMDDAKLKAAVDTLLTKHPRESVAVYLRAFNDLNEVNWPNLSEMLDKDSRLMLGV